MPVDFKSSETKLNLMRAFAGESQARNRYTFAASQAKSQNLHVIESVFTFTANQELAHAKIFYKHLNEATGENITVDGGYPVDISQSISQLLRYAHHNEFEEYDTVYKKFGEKAFDEGFSKIAYSFNQIALIEKTHGDRFEKFARLIEENKLFISDVECEWMCLNCGHILSSANAPAVCPVCSHNQGFFIRLEMVPFGMV